MTNDALRSRLFSEILHRREDEVQRQIIDAFCGELNFAPIDKLMISQVAWQHVLSLGVEPKIVFCHPSVLAAHPTTSLHYRGMTLLSQKRVQQIARVSVASWESGQRKKPVSHEVATKVACLYNTIISTIIEGSPDWTLANGYRNILATMGIMLDGMFRNQIGQVAEEMVRDRIVSWLKKNKVIAADAKGIGGYKLTDGTLMNFGSEPDIEFVRNAKTIATVEIKGGRDPAGALERLGAMSKSFEETPAGCINFLIAGVLTPEMQARLDKMAVVKFYLLDDIAQDGEHWDDFTNELFHHAIRVI